MGPDRNKLTEKEIGEISAMLKKVYAPLIADLTKILTRQKMTYDILMGGGTNGTRQE